MFDGLKDMGKLLKQAQEMRSKMKDVQEDLKKAVLQVQGMSGKIKLSLNGELEIIDIVIDPICYTPDHNKNLTKELKKTLNEGIKQAKDLATQKLSHLTGGLKLPGLGG